MPTVDDTLKGLTLGSIHLEFASRELFYPNLHPPWSFSKFTAED